MNVSVAKRGYAELSAAAGLLPNLVIAGAPKSGTSSVFRWLADHPQVTGSTAKETYYFVDPDSHTYDADRNFLSGGIEGYSRFFPMRDGALPRLVVEATPGYLYSELALREIPRLASSPHVVIILREPVNQIKSTFRYFQSNWNWIPSGMNFREFVAACEGGDEKFGGNELASNALTNAIYVDFLARWRRACGLDRLHVFLFEDVLSDERRFMSDLAKLFGLDASFYDTYDFQTENRSYSVRSTALQKLNIATRGWLPQGRFYKAARTIYRQLNTHTPVPQSDDVDVEIKLSERFRNANERLAREFDLDLSSWTAIQRARLDRQLRKTEH